MKKTAHLFSLHTLTTTWFSSCDRTGWFLVSGMEISLSDCGPRSRLLHIVLAWFGTSLITPSENRMQVGLPPASPVICTNLYDSHFSTSLQIVFVPTRCVSCFWWEESNVVSQGFYPLIEAFARALDRAQHRSSILCGANCFQRQYTKLCNGQQNMFENLLYLCFLPLSLQIGNVALSNKAQSFYFSFSSLLCC